MYPTVRDPYTTITDGAHKNDLASKLNQYDNNKRKINEIITEPNPPPKKQKISDRKSN